MKEFTRVLTIEVTQVEKFGNEWAGDVEKDTLSEEKQKESMESLKRMFQADDIHVKTKLFIRDDVEYDRKNINDTKARLYGYLGRIAKVHKNED